MTLLKQNRFYDKTTKRLMIKVVCNLCGEERISRYDHIRERYFNQNKEVRCKKCANIKSNGRIHKDGYVIRHVRSFDKKHWSILNSMSKSNGQIKEHRALLAIHLKRPLSKNEIVHHKNGIRNDNKISNLELCMIRQPMGQRVSDLYEEIDYLRNQIKILKDASRESKG